MILVAPTNKEMHFNSPAIPPLGVTLGPSLKGGRGPWERGASEGRKGLTKSAIEGQQRVHATSSLTSIFKNRQLLN